MISILLNTCREDYPIIGLPDVHLFQPTLYSLEKQNFMDFELIIIDACFSQERKEWIEDRSWGFPVKHINAFPNRFLERGMCAIASQKNKGLIHAEGELVVFIDDCTEFPPDWTRRIWRWFEKGYWPMSLTYYFEGGRPKLLGESSRYVEKFYGRDYDKEANLQVYVKKGEVVRDSRADFVNAHGTVKAPSQWFYGGSSASLEALLRVNGIDERFDGKKGLEDSDTGLRLEMAGYKGMFILDKNLYHVENWHKSLDQRVLHYRGPTPACNYALLQYNKLKGEFRANAKVLSREDCEWIRENICPACNNLHRCRNEEFKGRFFIDSEGFSTWLRLQRTFDLRRERLEL